MDVAGLQQRPAVVMDEVEARVDQPAEQVVHQLDVLRGEVLRQPVLHVGLLEGPPTELVRLQVDHAAAADGRRRRLLQVGRLEDQVLLVAHLDDLAAHQAQLREEETRGCGQGETSHRSSGTAEGGGDKRVWTEGDISPLIRHS